MVTTHNSLTTRENKSVYLYHRQLTSKHAHMNIVLLTDHTSIHHTPVPPVVDASALSYCPFLKQDLQANNNQATWTVHPHPQHYPHQLLPPRFCPGPHNTHTAARQNLEQHTPFCSASRASAAHTYAEQRLVFSPPANSHPELPPKQSHAPRHMTSHSAALLQSRLESLSQSQAAAIEVGGQRGEAVLRAVAMQGAAAPCYNINEFCKIKLC